MKIGLNLKIDVSKIDKTRFFKGQKGTYMDLTTFIDTSNIDQYGNNGFISQSTTKEERDSGIRTEILGNVKVFFNDGETTKEKEPEKKYVSFDDDIPF